MKRFIVFLMLVSNIVIYSQWNNGSILFNQVRANIEFIDSNNLLLLLEVILGVLVERALQ